MQDDTHAVLAIISRSHCTQYDRLLASCVCLSVCLSVCDAV